MGSDSDAALVSVSLTIGICYARRVIPLRVVAILLLCASVYMPSSCLARALLFVFYIARPLNISNSAIWPKVLSVSCCRGGV